MNHKKDRNTVFLKNVIRTYRELYGVSDEQLATAAYMSLSTFYRRLQNPAEFTLQELGRIVKRLQIPKEEILPYIL